MRILDITVCDDIRTEIGNKFTLCGVYQEKILIPKGTPWPASFSKFCLFIKLLNDARKKIKGKLIFQRASEKERELSDFEISGCQPNAVISLPIVFNVFQFSKPGKIEIYLDCTDEKGNTERIESPITIELVEQ